MWLRRHNHFLYSGSITFVFLVDVWLVEKKFPLVNSFKAADAVQLSYTRCKMETE